MGCHLAVGANSFAQKWFAPIARANKFAPTDPLTEEHALFTWKSATLAAYSKQIIATLSRELTPPCGWGEWELEV
jgi:hypothetical protein